MQRVMGVNPWQWSPGIRQLSQNTRSHEPQARGTAVWLSPLPDSPIVAGGMVSTLRLLATAIVLLLALGHVSPAAAQGNPTDEIFNRVNQFRTQFGLAPFTFNPQLAAAAQGHANYLASNGLYSHYGSDGSDPQLRAERAGYTGWAGENYVAGTRLTPQQGVTWWSNSAPHYANMVSNRHTEAGVGYAFGHDQNYYVLVIGSPSETAPRVRAQLSEAPAFVAPIELSPPREDGSIVHQVLPGHTMWAIAARYGVSLANLYLFNGLNDDSFLSPGDELVIQLAEGQEPPPTPTPPAFHTVLEGESLWSISAWHQIPMTDLMWLNGLPEDAVVHPGNEIKIRLVAGEAPPPTATPQLTHFVESGDTIYGIAARYGLSADNLLAYNNLSLDSMLQIDQELVIVPPTTTPEATFPPTFTPVPTPTGTPIPTATADLTNDIAALSGPVMAPTPQPEDERSGLASVLGMGAMVAGLGLTVLAAAAVILMRRDGP